MKVHYALKWMLQRHATMHFEEAAVYVNKSYVERNNRFSVKYKILSKERMGIRDRVNQEVLHGIKYSQAVRKMQFGQRVIQMFETVRNTYFLLKNIILKKYEVG